MTIQTVKHTFAVDELRDDVFLEKIHHLIRDLPLGQMDRHNLNSILTELITNSVEHGLLDLDSNIKKNANGFEAFYRIRNERLQKLQDGFVSLNIQLENDEPNNHVRINIEDSGVGFNFIEAIYNTPKLKSLSGRGLMIVQNLCSSLNFSEKGNQLEAVYQLESKSQSHKSDSESDSSGKEEPSANCSILIIDDDPIAIKFLTTFLSKLNYVVLSADDGESGIEFFDSFQPDIVLTDFSMPGKTGLDVIHHIRSQTQEYWTTVIVLSAMHEIEKVVDCLEAGADDYMTKPVNLQVLKAKLATYSRLTNLQKDNLTTKASLKAAYESMSQEEILAESLLTRILKRNPTNLNLKYWLEPATRFSGDLVTFAETRSGDRYVILADVAGHGLSASFTTLIITQIFHDMVERECSLTEIADKLNSVIFELLPVNFFAAACIMKVNAENNAVELWSGGLPDVLVVDLNGQVLERIAPFHMSLGVLPTEKFSATTKHLSWPEPVHMLVYSDGLIESENEASERFGEERLIAAIDHLHDTQAILNKIKAELAVHMGTASFQDDVTALLIEISAG